MPKLMRMTRFVSASERPMARSVRFFVARDEQALPNPIEIPRAPRWLSAVEPNMPGRVKFNIKGE